MGSVLSFIGRARCTWHKTASACSSTRLKIKTQAIPDQMLRQPWFCTSPSIKCTAWSRRALMENLCDFRTHVEKVCDFHTLSPLARAWMSCWSMNMTFSADAQWHKNRAVLRNAPPRYAEKWHLFLPPSKGACSCLFSLNHTKPNPKPQTHQEILKLPKARAPVFPELTLNPKP